PLHDRMGGWLPRYAPYAASFPWLLNLRDRVPGVAQLSEALAGFSARRSLPRWRSDWYRDGSAASGPSPSMAPASGGGMGRGKETGGREVVLFVDTFSRYFEPENIEAELSVLAG